MAGLVLLTSLPCLAERDYEMEMCRDGHFPHYPGQYASGKINASEGNKAYFYDDDTDKGCPANQAQCQQKAYLIEGDNVLVAQEQNGWSCVGFQGKKSVFVGWLQSRLIEKQPTKPPVFNDWLGTWRNGENNITLTQGKNGALRIKGRAYWHGGVSPSGEENVHLGSLAETAQPTGNRLEWGKPNEEFKCAGAMRLINGQLVVADNNECGGMNVSFSGVYRLQK
ncbi:putative; ORF located using Glimmer/Genemark [Dickeya aquatica]|uniref:Putative ORF located using Glimmer/Genemark n=2 Tax=Pectobacteriaceae TaxID=1903410 RepID=A0A375AG35_9GAMM|nr:putative; ORF located using Glimmer/Genemark [Dickeya aquatica]